MRPVLSSRNDQLRDVARAMVEAAGSGRSVATVLRQRCRHVYRQIVRDGKHPELLSLWGRSTNVDENAGKIIVHPAILRAIGELAGVPMAGRIVHAGLQHTYGYLFSLIETPHGFKRDRWTSTDLERGFGIDLSLLSDQPREGSLLSNLTWLAGQISFRGQPHSLRRLELTAPTVSPALVQYDFARLQVCRIVERVLLSFSPGREVLLITDLASFPRRPANASADSALLIYSVQNGATAPIKLITAFPVRAEVLRELKASVPRQGDVEIRLRYNAYARGLLGRTLPGQRFFSAPRTWA